MDVDVGEFDNFGALVGTNHVVVGVFVGTFGVLLNVGAFVLTLGCALGVLLLVGPSLIVGATVVPSSLDCSVGPLVGLGVNLSTACWITLHN